MKIGVRIESFKKSLTENIALAAAVGVQGVQFSARAEGNPDLSQCSEAELVKILDTVRKHGLEISAVCGDIGGAAFQLEHEWPARFDFLRRTADACQKLGVKIITSHIGHIPDCAADPVYPTMVKTVREIAEYMESMGITMAIETGPELADVLKTFIETVNSKGLGVNLDPANLRGVSGEDPVYAVQQLAPYIVHTHAKDAVNLYVGSAAKFYGLRNPDGSLRQITARAAGFKEVPLGEGMVPWEGYLQELQKAGFDGYLTIERECGDHPEEDVRLAVAFLQEKLSRN